MENSEDVQHKERGLRKGESFKRKWSKTDIQWTSIGRSVIFSKIHYDTFPWLGPAPQKWILASTWKPAPAFTRLNKSKRGMHQVWVCLHGSESQGCHTSPRGSRMYTWTQLSPLNYREYQSYKQLNNWITITRLVKKRPFLHSPSLLCGVVTCSGKVVIWWIFCSESRDLIEKAS